MKIRQFVTSFKYTSNLLAAFFAIRYLNLIMEMLESHNCYKDVCFCIFADSSDDSSMRIIIKSFLSCYTCIHLHAVGCSGPWCSQ